MHERATYQEKQRLQRRKSDDITLHELMLAWRRGVASKIKGKWYQSKLNRRFNRLTEADKAISSFHLKVGILEKVFEQLALERVERMSLLELKDLLILCLLEQKLLKRFTFF